MDIYSRLLKPLLFSLPPEAAHHLAIFGLRLTPRSALKWAFGSTPSDSVRMFGLNFPNRVGLGAGKDKDARAKAAARVVALYKRMVEDDGFLVAQGRDFLLNAIGFCECLRIARFSISQELNRDFQRARSSRACGRCVCEIVACSHVRVARRGKRES
jgi:dihydroorotate dehydrogenase